MTDAGGYIKVFRKMTEWEWYGDTNVVRVFLHCLLKANWSDKSYRGTLIKRGEFLTGRDQFAREVNLSVQNVRTAWDKLKLTGELTIKSTTQGTRIQVVKYEDYQEVTNEATAKQPTTNQRLTTTNNNKNKKKGNGASVLKVKNGVNDGRKKTRWGLIIPTAEEVVAYFKENGYTAEAGHKAFKYYDVADWKDSKGDPVRSWKQKVRAVWFKDEYKKRKINPYKWGG